MSRDPMPIYIGSLVVVMLLILAAAIYFSIQEEKQWNAFAESHDCKIVGRISGYYTYGLYNGKYQNVWIPERTTYHCNDGIEYTR